MFAFSLLAIAPYLLHALAVPTYEQKKFLEPFGHRNKSHFVSMPDANQLQEVMKSLVSITSWGQFQCFNSGNEHNCIFQSIVQCKLSISIKDMR